MIVVYILQVVAMLALPAAGFWLIALGIAGRRDVTRPRCGRCRAELAFEHFDADAPCSACGTRVSQTTPTSTRHRPWWRATLGGFGLIAAAIGLAVLASVMLIRSVPGVGVIRSGGMNAALVASVIRSPIATDPALSEVRTRLRVGIMTIGELKSVILANLGPADAPTPARSIGALTLAAIAIERDPTDTAFSDVVLNGCFAPPSLWLEALETTSPLLQLDPTLEPPSDAPLTRVTVVRTISIDGAVQAMRDLLAVPSTRAALLPLPLKPLASGPHEVAIEIETFLFSRFDAMRIRGTDRSPLRESDWPPALARAKSTLSVHVHANRITPSARSP